MRNRFAPTKYTALLLVLSVFLTAFAMIAQAQETDTKADIDAVWSQSDGIRPEIYFSSYSSGNWTEPIMLTDDFFDNMHPVIDKDRNGRRWLFWTAYDNGRMEIHYKTQADDVWTESAVVASEMQSNIAPSVIIDKDNVAWLVWSGGNGRGGEIFWATCENGECSAAGQVNEANATPDMLPVVDLNDKDNPVVRWKGVRDGKIVDITSEWDGEVWSQTLVVEDEAEATDESSSSNMVELPDFMPASGLVFLRMY